MTASESSCAERMSVYDALRVLHALRGDEQIVITHQGSARLWPRISNHRLDFHYNPSTMGGAVPFATGLALARPEREVLVMSGEGALLMSLGSLVTAVAARVSNLTLVVLDNAMYEVTGGQRTPASGHPVDFAGMARAAGFPLSCGYHELDQWRAAAPNLFARPGPRFICLQVARAAPRDLSGAAEPIRPRLQRLISALERGGRP